MNKLLYKLHSLSVSTKLAFLIFSIIFIFSSSIVFLALHSSEEQTNEIIKTMISNNIQSNNNFLVSSVLANDNWALFKFLKAMSKNEIIKNAGITDVHHIVLAHTDTNKHTIGTILKITEDNTIFKIEKDNILLGYLVLVIEKSSIKTLLQKNLTNNFVFMLLAAFISFILAIYFMKNLLKRLNILHENAKAISMKRWNDIKEVTSVENDEISDMIKAIVVVMNEMKTMIQNEESLKNFYHKILFSTDNLIIICDKELNILYQNEHYLKKHTINNNSLKDFFIEDVKKYNSKKSANYFKEKISNKREKVTIYCQINKIDENIVISCSDITQLSQLKENEKITHSLKTLGEISSLFAHEMKNLLQPLKLLLEDNDEMLNKKDIKIIDNTLIRMDSQVIDFLSLSKPIDTTQKSKILVKEHIDEIDKLLKTQLDKKKITFTSNIDDDLRVCLNKSSLEKILTNLIHNSIDACDKNGHIKLEWHNISNNMSLLRFSDDGSGIDATVRENLFKPFFTTKKYGSGLGLFTIYKIVYFSGGNMTLADTKLTTFEIYLPTEDLR